METECTEVPNASNGSSDGSNANGGNTDDSLPPSARQPAPVYAPPTVGLPPPQAMYEVIDENEATAVGAGAGAAASAAGHSTQPLLDADGYVDDAAVNRPQEGAEYAIADSVGAAEYAASTERLPSSMMYTAASGHGGNSDV